jgi:hypothetical protein
MRFAGRWLENPLEILSSVSPNSSGRKGGDSRAWWQWRNLPIVGRFNLDLDELSLTLWNRLMDWAKPIWKWASLGSWACWVEPSFESGSKLWASWMGRSSPKLVDHWMDKPGMKRSESGLTRWTGLTGWAKVAWAFWTNLGQIGWAAWPDWLSWIGP